MGSRYTAPIAARSVHVFKAREQSSGKNNLRKEEKKEKTKEKRREREGEKERDKVL